jgi:multidrug efflux pump subunit AcrB
MLIGIVVTNAIVLLDLVEQLRHKGMSTRDALIQGGRTRVRPILMTAVATILALMPVALGFSEGRSSPRSWGPWSSAGCSARRS